MARSNFFVLSTFVLLTLVPSFVTPTRAQDQAGNRWEVYAMASSLAGDTVQDQSAPGFRIGGAWRQSRDLSLVVDASRHFISDQDTGYTTLMAGPRFYSRRFATGTFSHRRHDRWVTGFTQFMIGGQRSTEHGQLLGWNLVVAPGGGLELPLSDHLTFRIIEAELTLTQGAGVLRLSSGFSFRFGR